ncbi:MAG TPA: type II toxin-antitoxin system RelE/ParE family toxin [Acidimicrobiales bacterium]|nr:type II toxin-antitoxin system RelE/ParE family toxin [Acidimicrobiales bacterium]
MPRRSWEVEFDPAFDLWAEELGQADAEALLAAIRILRDQGPVLGRPLVDTIKGSRHKNMKELRPGSTGRTEIRALFAFDPRRRAILLVGGDKSDDWSGWYEMNIPIADERFEAHLARIGRSRTVERTTDRGRSPTKGKRDRR